MEREIRCPDCESPTLTRRHFVQAVGATAAAVSAASLPPIACAKDDKPNAPKSETLVKKLYDTLTPEQKKSRPLRLGPSAGRPPLAASRQQQLDDHQTHA